MALSLTHSGKAQQELLKAAEYNRKATFAAMFPRVSANGGYRWVSKNAHLLADEKAFGQGTAYAGNGGSFQWNDNSFLSQLAQQTAGTIFQQPILDLQNGIGSADIAEGVGDIPAHADPGHPLTEDPVAEDAPVGIQHQDTVLAAQGVDLNDKLSLVEFGHLCLEYG